MGKFLSTSQFAEAIGISESSARRLADAGELRVHRTKGGHRKIPRDEAIRYVRESGAQVVRPEMLGIAEAAGAPQLKLSYSDRLLYALQAGQAREVIGLIQTMYTEGITLAEICDGPLHFAMSTIGASWPHDKRSIFIEHRATLLCVRALCYLRASLPPAQENAPVALGGAPQDDPYLLPSLMASLVLHEAGYDETNLGPNTPLDVLTDSVEDERPDLVWLALTNPIRSRRQHREIEELAATVLSYGGVFLIGGQNAATFTGAGAVLCGSMNELRTRATLSLK